MHIIVCVDDRGGMLFNKRRQSRDRLLIADVLSELGEKKLRISSFSRLLFEGFEDRCVIDDELLEKASDADICFVENIDLLPYVDKINKITVYRWNRSYPGDFFFSVDPLREGFELMSAYEFEGYSHDKITREIFER